VILLYNNEGSNNCYNFVANETGAGGQFFIPVGTSTLMESTSDSPTVQGTPDCDYCGATYTTPGTWGPIGLGNTADGLQVRCPGCSDEEPAMFQAISYGTGFGTVAMGTNDLGGMFSAGTGTQQTYSYTFSTCITSGTPGTWTRTTAAGAGTPPATAGVVDAGVRTQLESCSIPCCGGFEEQPDEEAVAANGRYRFGFNGMEKDDEVYGLPGTSYAFEYRIHDARVGRFLSLDPMTINYPWNSPYSFAENRIIEYRDLEGVEIGQILVNTGDPLLMPIKLVHASDTYRKFEEQPVYDNAIEVIKQKQFAVANQHARAQAQAWREANPIMSIRNRNVNGGEIWIRDLKV